MEPLRQRQPVVRHDPRRRAAKRFDFSLDTPWKDLSDEARDIVLHGTPDEVSFYYRNRQGTRRQHETVFEGVDPQPGAPLQRSSERAAAKTSSSTCPRAPAPSATARGCAEILAVTVGGRNIVEVGNLSILDAAATLTPQLSTTRHAKARSRMATAPTDKLVRQDRQRTAEMASPLSARSAADAGRQP